MDAAFFERLLYEGESTTLDFKRDQYSFAKATDDEKSELLKDILGFANAWRRSAAYILIGVEEVRGGRSLVHGITTHLDDHSLQQFVNSLTNRPVIFQYEAFGLEGKQVGVIRIEEQVRPIYLKREYGRLKRFAVYVRRGSSTDPQNPASPDEVAEMGQTAIPDEAELIVGFGEVRREVSLGSVVCLEAERCTRPSKDTIPKYSSLKPSPLHGRFFGIQDNQAYWSELAVYEYVRRLLCPLRFLIKNTGRGAAKSVRLELRADMGQGYKFHYPSILPRLPRKESELAIRSPIPGTSPVGWHPGKLTIEKNSERYLFEIDCGDLQPGRAVWSDPFYFGSGHSLSIALSGHIFAENLSQPKEVSLSMAVNVRQTEMSIQELMSLPDVEDSEGR
jgi:hypothetical protein